MVLVLEANESMLSIFDEFGFEYSPSIVDGYLVFGPFSFDELYNIIIEEIEDLEIFWGLFKSMGADLELIDEGVILSVEDTVGGVFELNSMLSMDDVQDVLKVYHTQYFDLMGREILKPDYGVYIEVQHTNKGIVSNKTFIKN